LARLENDPATDSLAAVDATELRWLREGASPEVREVVFELSTDAGVTWSSLGSGVRISGGWERLGLNIPLNSRIRARGVTSSGQYNGSAGYVESVIEVTEFVTSRGLWRLTHFGSSENEGPGADSADPDQDGIDNLAEYSFGLDPNQDSTGQLPAWQIAGNSYSLSFTLPSEARGVSVVAERSPSMAPGSWIPIPNTAVLPLHVFNASVTGTTRTFFRLRIVPQ
jgi:hypothetical protein